MEQQAATIIGVLILTGIIWIARTANQTKEQLVALKTLLVGENGAGGINAEVTGLRSRQQETATFAQALDGRVTVLDFRVTTLEKEGAT